MRFREDKRNATTSIRTQRILLWWALSGATLYGLVLFFLLKMLPPLFWGVAAFTPARAPEITATVHELALLTLVTTDQHYIFLWGAITVVCLIPNNVVHSSFSRWFGYFTAWVAIMFEAGAIAFVTRTGPFAWGGLLVFWSPLCLLGPWIIVAAVLLFKALNGQAALDSSGRDGLVPAT